MSEQFLTSECLRKYYSELTFLCPNVTRKSRRQRERIKKKLKTQLSGKIRVNLKKIQVNNEQINEKTCIKGSSAEKSVVKEDQQYDVSKEDAEESDIIDVGVEDSAHIIISHESLLQQQTTENRYELDLTASIDTQCTTVTTTRTNLNINLQQRKFELTPNNNNGLSVNVDIPTFDVEKLQNGDTVSESSVEPAKVPTKVFVFNVPRAFTSCCFENPISFDLCKPEDMVQIIAPQVRNLLHKCPDDETLQATKILEQINDEHGMLINEKPSTSKRGRKRSTTNNNISGQPSAIKKKRGRKPKNQVQQEGELRSLTEFYENAGWIFEDQVATPQRVTDENIGLDSTVVNNNYVYNNNELVEFPLNPNGYTSVETLENLLKNSEPDPNANQLLAHNNNANNVDLTLNQIYYSVPLNIMNEAIDLQNANNKAEELENHLNLTQVNQFGEPYVCPVDEAFQEGLSMPNIDEMSNLLQTNFDANEITNIAEVKENTIDCPNELEADKENSIANQNNVLDIDDVVGFKEDAEQLMNFNNKGNEELTTKRKNKLEILSVVKLNVPLENIFPQEKRVLENGFVELPEENAVLANKLKGECQQKKVDIENNDKKSKNDERDQLVHSKFLKSKRFRQQIKKISFNILRRKKDQIKILKKFKLNGHIKKNIDNDRVGAKHKKLKTKEKDDNNDDEEDGTTTTKNGLAEQQIACEKNKLHVHRKEEHENSDFIQEFKLKDFGIKLQRLKTNGRQSWSSKREIHRQQQQQQQEQHKKKLTDICKNIGNNEDSQATVIDKMEKEEVVECQEAKQELDRIDIVEKKETFEKQLENVSQVTEGSFRLLSPDIFDDCLNLENEAIHSEGHECSIMKAEMNKIEEVERKCESYSWATGSQSPDIFENNDCLLLETETDVLPFTEKEEKSNPNEQKPPIMYDNEGLRSNDESDNKKQEKVVENKSMLEEEMEIVNNEISLNNELDDDVLSLSASSLSDFETEEVNVKENMKMKIKVTSQTLQPTPTPTPLPPLPPPPPTPLPQKKKNVSRFSPLVTTSNYDNIMATSTSFKTLLNNNYKIPKLVNSQRTSTPILTLQQAQQPETPISTGDLFPIATSTPIPTPITTKTMTLVNQREIFTEATTTTTATIQNKEKTLPNIRIQIVNKNTKYEKYKIVQKQNVENQTTLEMATVADHLLTPPGDNYGKSNLDLARIFGIDCFAHAFNNEEIPHEMCEKSHNLMPQSDVISILSTLSKEDLLAAYRFVKNHRRLFKEYAVCFTSNMVSRRYVDVLLAMVHDCRLYADLADVTLTFLFIALRQCDMEPDIICKAFLKSVLDHADETYFPVLHSLLGLIMVSGHWTRFSTEINQISNMKNFCMDFNFVSHMIETCLSTQLDECHTTLTLQCLLNLNSEVSQALREEESVIRFLQLFQKAS